MSLSTSTTSPSFITEGRFIAGNTDSQDGDFNAELSDEHLSELLKIEFKKRGEAKPRITPVPNRDTAFVFCLIKGKTRPVLAFLDSGCSTALVREGVPEKEFNSKLLKKGPSSLNVATGVMVATGGEWGMAIPLGDGTYQAVCALSVKQITRQKPQMDYRPALKKVQDNYPGNQ